MKVPIKLMFMSAAQMKDEIVSYLDQIKDENFLKVVHLMLNSVVKMQEAEDEIIGYRIGSNEPVYKSKLVKELDEAVARVNEGHFVTLEDVEAAAEKW